MLHSGSVSTSRVLKIGEIRIDRATAVATAGGSTLALGAKVVATLLALHDRAGDVVSKATLIENVWGEAAIDESSLWQNVHVLRGALKRHAPGARIETVKGRGYRLIANEPIVAAGRVAARRKLPAWAWSIAGAAVASLVFCALLVGRPLPHMHRVLVLVHNAHGKMPPLPPLNGGDERTQIVLAPIARN